MLDQIQHTLERDMAIGNRERESAWLRDVRGALQRLDRGTFGVCLHCAAEIGWKRLLAVPWTPSCLTCREAETRTQASPHFSTLTDRMTADGHLTIEGYPSDASFLVKRESGVRRQLLFQINISRDTAIMRAY